MTQCSPNLQLDTPEADPTVNPDPPAVSPYRVDRIRGLDTFRQIAGPWNNLWERTPSSPPTVRFEAIELWVREFSDPRLLTIVTVSDNTGLIAGIPLIRHQLGRILPIHTLPVNCWSHNGDLLLDPSKQPSSSVLEALIDGMRKAGVQWLALDGIPYELPSWQQFRAVLAERGARQYLTRQHPIGLIDTLGNWPAYEATWSSRFRSNIRRNLKGLRQAGELEVKRHRNPPLDQVDAMLRKAFAIEDRSWKGVNGTSVLRTPGMIEYMIEEARLMSTAGYLDIWFLELDGEPIAFEYAHLAKGTAYSHKIGFEPEFRSRSPGKLLTYLRLKQSHDDPKCRVVDTMGEFCPFKAKWSTRTYLSGRLYASLGGTLPNALVAALSASRAMIRKIRSEGPSHVPVARAYLQAIDSDDAS